MYALGDRPRYNSNLANADGTLKLDAVDTILDIALWEELSLEYDEDSGDFEGVWAESLIPFNILESCFGELSQEDIDVLTDELDDEVRNRGVAQEIAGEVLSDCLPRIIESATYVLNAKVTNKGVHLTLTMKDFELNEEELRYTDSDRLADIGMSEYDFF